VWDSLPPEVEFVNTTFADAPLIQNGNLIGWDISTKDSLPFVMVPGQSETISYTVRIVSGNANSDPIINIAETDYSDNYYFPGGPFGGKHPPVASQAFFYPLGRMWVFPNPYNPAKDGTIKFDNVVPGSIITIYTLSGEPVKTINTSVIRAYWDGRNWKGYECSPGIYLFTVKNGSAVKLKGKIFLIKQ
jgi:hypothetical protein